MDLTDEELFEYYRLCLEGMDPITAMGLILADRIPEDDEDDEDDEDEDEDEDEDDEDE